jgi:hypothetical protein
MKTYLFYYVGNAITILSQTSSLGKIKAIKCVKTNLKNLKSGELP